MRILFVTDIHGSDQALRWLLSTRKSYDALIVGGDITSYARQTFFSDFFALLEESTNPIYYVLGNHDPTSAEAPSNAKNIHGKREKISGFTFGGLGGSNITPFNTPFEIDDEEARRKLSALMNVDILISHCPPYDTRCDVTYSGKHVGSRPVREYIENTSPKTVLCGHIHESRAMDELDRSKIVNPGPLMQGNYAVLQLEDGIHVELKSERFSASLLQ